jgi:hypothetical protein
MPDILRPLLSASFWFRDLPDLSSALGRAWLGLGAALVLGGIACRVFARRGADKHAQRALRRAGSAAATMGLVALVVAFMSYENAGTLGSRFMYALWAAGALAWTFVIAHGAFKLSPALRQAERERREKEKYLP